MPDKPLDPSIKAFKDAIDAFVKGVKGTYVGPEHLRPYDPQFPTPQPSAQGKGEQGQGQSSQHHGSGPGLPPSSLLGGRVADAVRDALSPDQLDELNRVREQRRQALMQAREASHQRRAAVFASHQDIEERERLRGEFERYKDIKGPAWAKERPARAKVRKDFEAMKRQAEKSAARAETAEEVAKAKHEAADKAKEAYRETFKRYAEQQEAARRAAESVSRPVPPPSAIQGEGGGVSPQPPQPPVSPVSSEPEPEPASSRGRGRGWESFRSRRRAGPTSAGPIGDGGGSPLPPIPPRPGMGRPTPSFDLGSAAPGLGVFFRQILPRFFPVFGHFARQVQVTAESLRNAGRARDALSSLSSLGGRAGGTGGIQDLLRNPLLPSAMREQLAEQAARFEFLRRQSGRAARGASAARKESEVAGERLKDAQGRVMELGRERSEAFRVHKSALEKRNELENIYKDDLAEQDRLKQRVEAFKGVKGEDAADTRRAYRQQVMRTRRSAAAYRSAVRASGAASTRYGRVANQYNVAQARVGAFAARQAMAAAQHASRRRRARSFGTAAQGARAAFQATATQAARVAAVMSRLVAVGSVVGSVVALGAASLESVRRLKQFAESVNESNRRLAQFSAPMLRAFAELQFHDIQRGFREAAMTQDSAVRLTQAIDKMRDDSLRLNAQIGNLRNAIAAQGAGFVGDWSRRIGNVVDIGERLRQAIANQLHPGSIPIPGLTTLMGAFNLIGPAFETLTDTINKVIDAVNVILPKWLKVPGIAPDVPVAVGDWQKLIDEIRSGAVDGVANRQAMMFPNMVAGGVNLGVGFKPRP